MRSHVTNQVGKQGREREREREILKYSKLVERTHVFEEQEEAQSG